MIVNKLILCLFVTTCFVLMLTPVVWLFKSDYAEGLWEARQKIPLVRLLDQFSGRERFIKTQKAVLLIAILFLIGFYLCLMGWILTQPLWPVASNLRT